MALNFSTRWFALLAGAAFLSSAALADVQQRTGDWVVTSSETVTGANIVLSGNLFIRSGGSLTLINTTLLFAQAPTGQFGIQADAGSTVWITGSTIGPANSGSFISFVVNGGRFRMDHTTVSGVGMGGFSSVTNAIVFNGVAGAILDSNTINHPYVGVSLTNCTNAVIQNNTFAYSGTTINTGIAVWTVYSHYNTITNNHMLREYGEVTLFNSSNNYMAYNEATVTKDSLGFAIADNSGYNVVAYNKLTAIEPQSCTGFRSFGTTLPNYYIGNDVTGTREGGVMEYTAYAVVAGNHFHSMTDTNIGGIQLYRSHDVQVLNNDISGSPNGMVVAGSPNNVILGNTITGANFGLIMTRSAGNQVEGNTFDHNVDNVVLLTANGNTLAGNNFRKEQRQAYDDGSNTWSGNYFDDGQGGSYAIGGGAADATPASAFLTPGSYPVPAVTSGSVPPPLAADLLITQPTTWDGMEMALGQSVTVAQGGQLTIRNSKIWPLAGADRWINVLPGGQLVIENSELGGTGLDAYMSLTTAQGSSLTITDSKLRYLGDWDGNRGIELNGDGAVIERTEILGGYGGIDAPNSANHQFSDNRIADALASALIWGSGPSVAQRNVIIGTLWNALFATASGSTINGNWIDGGSNGLMVQGTNFGVRGNTVRNAVTGIAVGNSDGSATNNVLAGNALIDNGRQGFGGPPTGPQAGDQWGTSTWSENGRGNYWSSYKGVDNNGDGIGDTPYSFAQPAPGVDNYPLMQPPQPATPACVYLLGTPTVRLSASDPAGSVDVVALPGCAWAATSGSDWITVTTGGQGSGRGTVTFATTANTAITPRNGTIAIGNQTLAVEQAGNCSYGVGSSLLSANSAGGSVSVALTATSGCAWTVVPMTDWVGLSSANAGTGSATVMLTVAANTGDGTRTGFVVIAGQTVTVQQAPAADAAPHIDSVTNVASGLGNGVVTPGSYVVIRGTHFGPGTVQVFFDWVQAQVTTLSTTQATVYVPPVVAGTATAAVTVQAGGKTSAPFAVAVTPASPGIFTVSGSGVGQALAIDSDGTTNGPGNPAARGSIVTVVCTADGGLPVTVLLAGRALAAGDVVYTGPMETGVLQINFRVPDWAPAGGAVPLAVALGPDGQGRSYYSRDGVTVAIQ